ncbi:linear amide C-N hydrolase [Enterococcus sp. LJL98]
MGNIASIDELEQEIGKVNIVAVKNVLGIVVLLHWIIADQTGHLIIIEMTKSGLAIYENETRVMTNAPEYPWHLANLNHYSFLNNELKPASTFYKFSSQSGELRNGMIGLPGDDTSESRFIRTAFYTEFTTPREDSNAAINNMFHILSSVNIPRGVKRKDDQSSDEPDSADCV